MNSYIELIINGLCVGIGSGIGNYLVLKLFIKRVEQLDQAIKKLDKK